MKTVRRFQVAPALARLIRRERGSTPITEGHFATSPDRSSFVSLGADGCHLVLITSTSGQPLEERTDVPRGQAEVLLDVCAGRATYERSRLAVSGAHHALIDHFVAPTVLDRIQVEFEDETDAAAFQPPVWFGADVTDDGSYQTMTIALRGSAPVEAPLSNAALEAILDMLDDGRDAAAIAAPSRAEDGAPDAAHRQAPQNAAAHAPGQTGDAPAEGADRDPRMSDVFDELSRTLATAPFAEARQRRA